MATSNGKQDETSPLVNNNLSSTSLQITPEEEECLPKSKKHLMGRKTMLRVLLACCGTIIALIALLIVRSSKETTTCTTTTGTTTAKTTIEIPKDTSNISYRPLCEIYDKKNNYNDIKIIQTAMENPHLQWASKLCSSSQEEPDINAYAVPDAIINVNFDKLAYDGDRQTKPIMGFGGAFTAASALNFNSLSDKAQNTVIDLLFGKDGLGYSIGRVHINSCDFSIEQYTFDDIEDDFDLTEFDMKVSHDVKVGMIDMMKKASVKLRESWSGTRSKHSSVNDGILNMFASPWSPPSWMKNPTFMDLKNKTAVNGHASSMLHSSNYTDTCIRDGVGPSSKYAAAWALYYAKFITAYKQMGVDIFAISVQNEPEFDAPWEACGQSIVGQGDFIANHLGPTLRKYHPDVKILMFDHNKDHVLSWTEALIGNNPASSKYIDGIAVHWYTGGMDRVLDGGTGAPNMHTLVRKLRDYNKVKQTLILGSEACHCPHTGYAGGDYRISWERAEMYAHAILSDLAAGSNGWVEWNLLLDAIGGPNKIGNLCDTSLLAVPHRALPYENSSETDIEEPVDKMGYPLPDFETFDEDPFGAIIGDLRSNEELNNMGMPAKYLNQGIVVQPMYYYMGHISRYVRPGSQAVMAIVDQGNGDGRAFRPVGQTWAGGGITKLSRVGIELTVWPCEGSTKQHFYYNKKQKTIQVGGHDWTGYPVKSCIGNIIHTDYKGMTLHDCNSTIGEVGYYEFLPINDDTTEESSSSSSSSSSGNNGGGKVVEQVKIHLKNNADKNIPSSHSCLLVGPHSDGGGALGQRGGARVILGDCNTPAAIWNYSKEYGEFSSNFFAQNDDENDKSMDNGEVCMTVGWPYLQVGAFNTPNGIDHKNVVVVLNMGNEPANYALKDEHTNDIILTSSIPSRAIQTIALNKKK